MPIYGDECSYCLSLMQRNFPDSRFRIKAKHFHQSICHYPSDSTTKLENVS